MYCCIDDAVLAQGRKKHGRKTRVDITRQLKGETDFQSQQCIDLVQNDDDRTKKDTHQAACVYVCAVNW